MAAYFTRTGGSPVFPPSSVKSVVSGAYQIIPTDFYIGCNGTGITITLPLGSSVNPGQVFVVKDESGQAANAASYRVTVARAKSEYDRWADLCDHRSELRVPVVFVDWFYMVDHLDQE
jgi:hypothetical protein